MRSKVKVICNQGREGSKKGYKKLLVGWVITTCHYDRHLGTEYDFTLSATNPAYGSNSLEALRLALQIEKPFPKGRSLRFNLGWMGDLEWKGNLALAITRSAK